MGVYISGSLPFVERGIRPAVIMSYARIVVAAAQATTFSIYIYTYTYTCICLKVCIRMCMHTPINLQAGVHASVSFAQDENEPTNVTDGDASVASSDYNGATEMPTYPDWNIFGEVALREGAQLDVDSELVRSISLARTLLVVSRESRKR